MAVKFLNGIDVDGSLNLATSDIPNLAASKITSGTFGTARIPNLAASKITSGTLGTARIPDLSATYATAAQGTLATNALRSDASDVYDGRTLSFGTAGNGSNTSGAFLTVEGNTDSSGEGSGRLFFREHNSSTAAADNYGMSMGYRGGSTAVNSAMGNSWTGLSQIGNGEWGMWGHNNDAAGALIMHGDRAGTYVDFSGNNIQGINNATISGVLNANGSFLGDGNLFLRSYNNDPKGIFFRDGFEYGDTNQYNLSITCHDDGDGAADGMMISAYDGVRFNVASGSTPNVKFSILNTEVKAYANFVSTGTITGTNLSGSNTGDQDLSSYYNSSGSTYTKTSGTHLSLKNTTSSGYSEFNMSNDLGHKLVMGSIGSTYSNSAWAGSRYIYTTSGELRIKAATNLRLYSGGNDHTGDLAVTFDSSQDATFTGTIAATNLSGSSSGTNTGDQDLSSYLTAETFSATDVVFTVDGNDVVAGDDLVLAGGLTWTNSTKTLTSANTNTTYTVQDGELSQNNFTNADHTKLNGIEAGATTDQDLSGYLTTTGKAADSNLLDGLDSTRFYRTVTSSSGTAGAGWVTVAKNQSGRRHGEVIVSDGDSGDHAFIRIDWMRSYADSNFSVINVGGHQNRITGVRVLSQSSDATYGWKYLQVYVTTSSLYGVKINSLGAPYGYSSHTAVTPVVQDTLSGYVVYGNALSGLEHATFAAEEGIVAGGVIYASGGNSSSWNTAYTHSQATHAPTDANNYVHPVTAGNKHVPTGGAAGQFLKYSASGTAVWATPSYTTNTNTTYSVQDGELSQNNFTNADHTKLNGIETGATADQDLSGLVDFSDVAFTFDGNDIIIGDDLVLAGGLSYTDSTKTLTSSDTNTTYSVGDNGLTAKNFTAALKTKLDGIAAGATTDQTLPTLSSLGALSTDGGTLTGSLTIGDGSAATRLIIKRVDSTLSDDIQFFNGTTRVGEIGTQDTTWLRINQSTNKNIYTPRYIRADNGFFVDGTAKGINGSGNFIGGTIAGASDANVAGWNTAYGWGNHGAAGYAEESHTHVPGDVGLGNLSSSGNALTGSFTATGDITAFSDARVKENVETIPNALDKVKAMRGVGYNKIGADTQSVGVIAQELEEVVPQLVHTDEEGMKSVAYGNITAVLIEAIKEQQVQIEELKARLDGLTK